MSVHENLRADYVCTGPAVLAHAQWDGSGNGILWLADANEKDPLAAQACRVVNDDVASRDLVRADLGETLVDIDRRVLARARTNRASGALLLSAMIARVSTHYVTIAFVGESRGHVFDDTHRLTLVTREHNMYNMIVEGVWKAKLGYSEEAARDSILRILGDGNAIADVSVMPRGRGGAVVVASHCWHRHLSPENYQSALISWIVGDQRPDVARNEGLAMLSWGPRATTT